MSNLYIQANFNEIDLRDVRDGDKVIIIPRVFFGSKIYHGVVVGNSWAANRQITTAKNQIQTVTENENNWVMLPQRLPVQIRITDYDNKNYPLSIGSSAYIYIQTR
jgi:multidrug resistance efflux pump